MKKIRVIRTDEEDNRYYTCPICGNGEIKIKGELYYGRCDKCKATLIDYNPLDYQEAFHKSNAQYRLNIGG